MAVDLGIDLGTTKILIYRPGKGIVLEEPSVVAYNTRTSEVVAVGHEALRMMGRAPAYIQIECPVREGVISNHEFTEFLIREFVRKVSGSFLSRPRIAICIPRVATKGGRLKNATTEPENALMTTPDAIAARQPTTSDSPVA